MKLQCNREGLNAFCESGASSARIVFVSNDASDCYGCDLRIGFGTAGYPDDLNVCGAQITETNSLRLWETIYKFD